MKFAKQVFSLIFLVSLFLACSKEDGQDGAIGPAGPQGEQGITGANGADGMDGEQGEQGETGTANVLFSDWIASEFNGISAAELSEQLLVSLGLSDFNTDQDLMMIYGRHSVNALNFDILQLPYELTSQNEIYRYRLSEGSGFTALYIENTTTDGGTNLFTYFDDYRYIIIPGGNATSGKSSNSIDYTKMSYKEIVTHLNISE